MKVTLDLSRLLQEGKISQAEYDRLASFGHAGTASLAFNILIGFGVAAVAAGIVALVPDARTGIVLGGAILAAGLYIYITKLTQWDMLAHILVLVGALVLGGGVVVITDAAISAFLLIAAGFTAAAVAARSGLLISLAVLALSSAIGARTDYMHASYFLGIEQPAFTILIFGALAVAAYIMSKNLSADYERLALMAARTSVLLVNFGFWVGSLWGDRIGLDLKTSVSAPLEISDVVFSIMWALVLAGSILWAVKANRQWVVNVMAVFAAIHFYTQWFERLGPEPVAILIGGLCALGFAAGLFYFNKQLWGGKIAG